MTAEQLLKNAVVELARTLTNDGHQIEEIPPHRWKAIALLTCGSEEKENRFESRLDTDLYVAQRCRACGRAFLVLKVKDSFGNIFSHLVTDEEGDEIDPMTEPACAACADK